MPEGCDRRAGLRVQGDQAVARRYIEDTFVSVLYGSIGPIRKSAPGKLARSVATALAFVLAVHPELFAGGRIQRHHRASGSARGIEDAVRHQRRALQIIFRLRAEILRLEMPRGDQLVEVGGINLIERSVARVGGIASGSCRHSPFLPSAGLGE